MFRILSYISNLLKEYEAKSYSALSKEDLNIFFKKAITSCSKLSHNTSSKGQSHGDIVSNVNGHGIDYSESKLYASGDDYRLINWKQTAKAGELVSNKYYQESENIDYIMFDHRKPMAYGTQIQTKLAIAIKVAVLSSVMALSNHRKVVIISISNKLHINQPMDSYDSVLKYFSEAAKQNYDTKKNKELPLSTLLKYIQSIKAKFSTISIISDFHDLNPKDLACLKEINCNNDVSLFHIQDTIERRLPALQQINYQSLSSISSVTFTSYSQLKRANRDIKKKNTNVTNLLLSSRANFYYYDNNILDSQLLQRNYIFGR